MCWFLRTLHTFVSSLACSVMEGIAILIAGASNTVHALQYVAVLIIYLRLNPLSSACIISHSCSSHSPALPHPT